MKKLDFCEMEIVQGGEVTLECAVGIANALVWGTGGLIATAASGGWAIGFAIAGNFSAWIGAAMACSDLI